MAGHESTSPEHAARLQDEELDMEVEKASARLNMILNVAAFVVIVGVLRVGKYKMLAYGICIQCDLICTGPSAWRYVTSFM